MIPRGGLVLEVGCGTGNLLAALRPSRGMGIDVSPRMIERARANHPDLVFEAADAESFHVDDAFDYVVASDLIAELGDITAMLECVQQGSRPSTKLILTFHSPTLEAVLRVPQRAGLSIAPVRQN